MRNVGGYSVTTRDVIAPTDLLVTPRAKKLFVKAIHQSH